jgi:hypothetical protein
MQWLVTTPSTNHWRKTKCYWISQHSSKGTTVTHYYSSRRLEPVESRYGNNVTGAEAEFEQPTSQTQHFLHKLLSGLLPVAGDCDDGITPRGCEEAEALANVAL